MNKFLRKYNSFCSVILNSNFCFWETKIFFFGVGGTIQDINWKAYFVDMLEIWSQNEVQNTITFSL
jgi:hypothetical protein